MGSKLNSNSKCHFAFKIKGKPSLGNQFNLEVQILLLITSTVFSEIVLVLFLKESKIGGEMRLVFRRNRFYFYFYFLYPTRKIRKDNRLKCQQ